MGAALNCNLWLMESAVKYGKCQMFEEFYLPGAFVGWSELLDQEIKHLQRRHKLPWYSRELTDKNTHVFKNTLMCSFSKKLIYVFFLKNVFLVWLG